MSEIKFEPYVGDHCESTMLVNLLRQKGLEISEAMVFGLGQGLNYIHWQSSTMPYPFIGGRTKPDSLTETLSCALGLQLDVRETASLVRALSNVVEALDAGKLVGLKLDHYYLDYFREKSIHFCAHYATLYKVNKQFAHLIDTHSSGGGGQTSLSSLAEARAARGPMSSKNLSVTLADGPWLPALREALLQKLPAAILRAIAENAHTYLNPPIKNIGYKGVLHTSRKIGGWLEEVANPSESLPIIGMLMERAGTGGGMFRKIYARFLQESYELTQVATLDSAAQEFSQIAELWSEVAELIERGGKEGSRDSLLRAAKLLAELSSREKKQFSDLEAAANQSLTVAKFSGAAAA